MSPFKFIIHVRVIRFLWLKMVMFAFSYTEVETVRTVQYLTDGNAAGAFCIGVTIMVQQNTNFNIICIACKYI